MGDNTITVTDESFASDVLQSEKPVLVDFWASWCGPCKMLAPVLDQIAAENSAALVIAKLEADVQPNTPRDFQVMNMPTLILFKDGTEVHRIVGAKSKAAILRELGEFVDF